MYCLCNCANRQWPRVSNQAVCRQQLRDDFDSLHLWLQITHPKLYSNADSTVTEKNWATARRRLQRPMTKESFRSLISPLVHQYNDGHTFTDLAFESPECNTFQENGGKLFPLEVKIINKELVVQNDIAGKQQVSPGTVVRSINNIPVKKIITQLSSMVSGDYTEGGEASISRLFSFLLWNRYKWKNFYKIDWQNERGTIFQLEIDGISANDYFKHLFPASPWTMNIHEPPGLAVIECSNYSGNINRIRLTLDSFFTIIKEKNIKYVALDLRRNGGGNSYIGDIFLSYITQQPFAAVASKTYLDSRSIGQLPAGNWLRKEVDSIKLIWNRGGNYYTDSFQPAPPPPLKDEALFFKGKFYLFTGYRTYSSAHMTAMQVKCANLGVIIGEPTDLTGEIMELKLPNTKVIVVCPTAMYKAACRLLPKPGLQPHHLVNGTIEDLKTGNDAALEFLKSKIKAGESARGMSICIIV